MLDLVGAFMTDASLSERLDGVLSLGASVGALTSPIPYTGPKEPLGRSALAGGALERTRKCVRGREANHKRIGAGRF